MTPGVDVSSFQPVISWPRVASAGQAFAFCKVTEGMSVSSAHYAEQIAGARAAGLLVGAYHFFRTTSDALAQARRFVAAAGDVDLPLAIDVEDQHPNDPLGGIDPTDFAERVAAFLVELAKAGRRPLLYISPGFAARLPDAGLDQLADLWVAHYDVVKPRLPHGFGAWKFWQFSGSATIPGIGRGDVNYFNGTAAELRTYCGRSIPPPDLATGAGLQAALNQLGASPALVEDGIVGPKTRAALEAWQLRNGLTGDGLVGPATLAALRAALG